VSKADILAELPNLSKAERHEIRLKLAEMDGGDWLDADDPLSEAHKEIIDSRLAEHERNPQSAISLERFQQQLATKLKR
jgi:hypothetical protein